MPDFITIGVYGFDEASFFQALQNAGVDTFYDLRARRGMRGSAYVFANSKRLQAKLAGLGIRYLHRPELAPSQALRQRQADVDKSSKTARRKRTMLSPAFVDAYKQEILAGFDSTEFISSLGSDAHVVALFCVEREPAACHRSLLAARLAEEQGVSVSHLMPANSS